jgi:formamidopyrimidine-DNA glycosylase
MPELPEVETIMTLVKQRVENKKIKKTKVLNPKLRWPIDSKKD